MNKTCTFKVSAIVGIKDLPKRKRQRTRVLKYEKILKPLSELIEGQGFTIEDTGGLPSKTFLNRLNSAIKRSDIKAPADCRFKKETQDDGSVAIRCEQKTKRRSCS